MNIRYLALIITLLLLIVPLTNTIQGQATVYTVTTTVDAVDVNPGDGDCDTGNATCSLRAAV